MSVRLTTATLEFTSTVLLQWYHPLAVRWCVVEVRIGGFLSLRLSLAWHHMGWKILHWSGAMSCSLRHPKTITKRNVELT